MSAGPVVAQWPVASVLAGTRSSQVKSCRYPSKKTAVSPQFPRKALFYSKSPPPVAIDWDLEQRFCCLTGDWISPRLVSPRRLDAKRALIALTINLHAPQKKWVRPARGDFNNEISKWAYNREVPGNPLSGCKLSPTAVGLFASFTAIREN